jgi:type IV secretion system protein TrbE
MPIYEQLVRSFQFRYKHLSDKLPWRSIACPGVILHKTGALQRSYAVRGPDLSHEIQEAQGARMQEANMILMRLGGGWTLHGEMQRVRWRDYPATAWPNAVCAAVDEHRRRAMVDDPGSLDSIYFLTLTWQPPPAFTGELERLVVTRPEHQVHLTQEERDARTLETFITQADYWMYLLKGMLAEGHALSTDDAATYLKTTVSPRWTPVCCRWPLDLDVRLADVQVYGGWYPFWSDGPDEIHFRVAAVTGYPASSTADIMRLMNAADIEYRWVTRAIALPKMVQQGLLRKTRGNWYGHRLSLMGRVAEVESQREAPLQDNDAINKALQADAAQQEIGEDIVAIVKYSALVQTWDRDPDQANAKLNTLRQILESKGFGTRFEKQHAFAMWCASHPGNRLDGVRQSPTTTMVLAHTLPGLQSQWRGPERDEHLQERPWWYAHALGRSLHRVVNHVLDNGLFQVLGPTRSGKTTLLGLMVSQWLNNPSKQAFLFDYLRSSKCLTWCLGGRWYDLGSGEVGLQPYRKLETAAQRAWRAEWTLRRLEENRIPLTEHVQTTIPDAIERLARALPRQRTLTEFVYILEELQRHAEAGARNRHSPYYARMKQLARERGAIAQALGQFTRGQVHGLLLDSDHDDLAEGPLHCFEQATLLNMPRLVEPVMEFVMHEVEERFSTSRPALVPMDDAAVTWALKFYERKGKEWLVTKAKLNASLGFFTHSLEQVYSSALGTLLIESCATTFALPNKAAMSPAIADIYARMGFNAAEIRGIATARAQRDVYVRVNGVGSQLLSVEMDPFLLAIFARNTEAHHARMDAIMAEVGPEAFPMRWLEDQGFPEDAAWVRRYRKEQRHAAAD